MKTFSVKYELGHSYEETWDKSEYFCPHCGKNEVWEQQGDGDYYQGVTYLCISCGGIFHLPQRPRPENWQDQQRIAELKP